LTASPAPSRVHWLGGGSGAGKSTIARRVAARHGLRVYSTDDAMARHAARCTPEEAPHLHRFLAMDMDERWVRRSPRTMLDTFHWYRGEGFRLIVDDLRAIDTGVIVEGFRLLPDLVAPLAGSAVWLLPTPEFRRAAFARRGTDIPRGTSDPDTALRNLLERDGLFTERLRQDTRRLGLPAIDVVPGMTEDEVEEAVTRTLQIVV
jgi:2-phosphoglycerate kinase